VRENKILLLVASLVLAFPTYAQEAKRPALPLSYKYSQQLKGTPGAANQLGAKLPPVVSEGGRAPRPPLPSVPELQKFGTTAALEELRSSNEFGLMSQIGVVQGLATSPVSPEGSPAQLWSNLANFPDGGPYNFGNPLLLTDGTVIVHRTDTPDWYKLTPDSSGSYVNGTWSQIASMPPTYGPKFFASAVLPDGRVIAEGGEYNLGPEAFTSMGAIYDPTGPGGGAWTSVAPPAGWTQIGDGQSSVLANGTFMLSSCCDDNPFRAALLNPTNLAWTATGTNKADRYDEEGWTLIPNGSLLTVDAYTTPIGNISCGVNTEIYGPATGSWSNAGNVPTQLADCNAKNADGGSNPTYEMGPQVMMFNDEVIAFGGTTANVVHTALYNTAAKKPSWTAGSNLPTTCGPSANLPCTLADAPATILPTGNVLFVASAGRFAPPANFFEYSPSSNTITAVPGTADASAITSFYVNLLILPTGQILAVETYTPTIQIYSPSGDIQDSLRPVVTSTGSSCVVRGDSYVLNGTQLNGLSQGASYGDDQQAATNYPLVRIVNKATGHVFYARTSGHSTMTIERNAPGSTHFTVATGTEIGASTLYVVANGIPSAGSPITVAASACPSE
jgi:hypothetical protein